MAKTNASRKTAPKTATAKTSRKTPTKVALAADFAVNPKDRRGNFVRLANLRSHNAVKAIQLIGNLSNTNDYEFNDADVTQVFTAIRNELAAAEARFQVSKLRATRKPVQLAA